MKKTIYKYELAWQDYVDIEMPVGATPLTVGAQNGKGYLWALVEPDAPVETRRFRHAGTGHPIQDTALSYIGTYMDGSFVFHVFEIDKASE